MPHEVGTASSLVPERAAAVEPHPGTAETARLWNELVRAYSAPGADALLHQVPDTVSRPLGGVDRSERREVTVRMRRQAAITLGLTTGTVGAVAGATTAGSPLLPATVCAASAASLLSVVRWHRLGRRRKALGAGDGHATWQMTRFGRWLVARAHQATVRAVGTEGGPGDTADRMAESLHQFTGEVRDLERILDASTAVADTYGRLRDVRGHHAQVRTLLDAQAHVLRALDLFETTAREVVLAARAERADGGPVGVVPSLLDLQAEALTRREALAALDGAEVETGANRAAGGGLDEPLQR